MAIKDLIKLIQNKNIAEDLDDNQLMKIGRDVCSGYQKDWDSMVDWREDVEAGLKLVKPANKSKSEPWQGAANFKTPIIMRARQKFGDRASQELLQGDDLVKMKAVGKETEELSKRIERVTAVMNWQLGVESKGWMEQQDKLLYDISTQGNIFKKTYFSQSHGYNISEVIKYPNFAIHQDTTCFDEAERFTHRQWFYARDIDSYSVLGIWLDIDLKLPEDCDVVEFFEQQCWLDLDDDGIYEPYLVTVHKDTESVVRIKAQFRIDNITVMTSDFETMGLDELIQYDAEKNPVFNDKGNLVFIDDKVKVIKINREDCVTNYEFIKDPQGKFLSVGYFHLLGSYAEGINTTTNQLLDAGTLSNLQGGWLAKGFRKRLGNVDAAPGQWIQTDLSAQDLQLGVKLFDFKEPSPTLFQLNEKLTGEAESLASMLDLGDAFGQNTTATTALSIIQEAQEANGAIILRIYRAMGREFSIWYRLNSRYINPRQYKELVNNKDVDPFEDFNTADLDVMPAANPKMSSKIQRMQQGQAQLAVIDQIAATGGNPKPVVVDYLESIGSTSIEEIYPELTPEQEQMMAAEQEKQKQLQEMEFVTNLKATENFGEAELLKANVRLVESQTKAHQAAKDMEEKDARIRKIEADTFLTIEKAETESTKNAVSIVNAERSIASDGAVVEGTPDDEYKKAQARKLNAEAEAQELENDLIESGMIELLKG